MLRNIFVDVEGNVEVLDRIERIFDWHKLHEDPFLGYKVDDCVSLSGYRMTIVPQLRLFIQGYLHRVPPLNWLTGQRETTLSLTASEQPCAPCALSVCRFCVRHNGMVAADKQHNNLIEAVMTLAFELVNFGYYLKHNDAWYKLHDCSNTTDRW